MRSVCDHKLAPSTIAFWRVQTNTNLGRTRKRSIVAVRLHSVAYLFQLKPASSQSQLVSALTHQTSSSSTCRRVALNFTQTSWIQMRRKILSPSSKSRRLQLLNQVGAVVVRQLLICLPSPLTVGRSYKCAAKLRLSQRVQTKAQWLTGDGRRA